MCGAVFKASLPCSLMGMLRPQGQSCVVGMQVIRMFIMPVAITLSHKGRASVMVGEARSPCLYLLGLDPPVWLGQDPFTSKFLDFFFTHTRGWDLSSLSVRTCKMWKVGVYLESSSDPAILGNARYGNTYVVEGCREGIRLYKKPRKHEICPQKVWDLSTRFCATNPRNAAETWVRSSAEGKHQEFFGSQYFWNESNISTVNFLWSEAIIF